LAAKTENIAEALLGLAVPLDRLEPLPGNPRLGDVEAVMRSYERFGQRKPIVVRKTGGTAKAPRGQVIAGNHQLEAARRLGWKRIAVVWVDEDRATALAYSLADNRTSDVAGYDDAALAALLRELGEEGGVDLVEDSGYSENSADRLLAQVARDQRNAETQGGPSLSDRFVVPPLSLLDARQGYWQDRRRDWMALGIRSEEGRGENLLGMSEAVLEGYEKAMGFYKPGAGGGVLERPEGWTGTSVFDPVLCEIAYRWFSPEGARVLDPFAGGSVRGIVAGRLGRRYEGIELQGQQVKANREQLSQIGADPAPKWVAGDARDQLAKRSGPFDLIFSCPPYADLERYSDDPRDLSAMPWPEFCQAYREIIAGACELLAEDRFAVWVIGEVRSKEDDDGRYRGLVPETIAAFEAAGLSFYNEAILVTPIGSLALRAPRFFSASRKLGKTHQNVLVFCKGDGRKAAEACGEIDVDLAAVFGEEALPV
jgi:hypothetical protein